MALICVLAVHTFAAEFTVATEGEFNNAYSQAQDGDTIVITADVSAQFNFGKTILMVELNGQQRVDTEQTCVMPQVKL